MELYVARHGQTQFNAEGRYQGGGQDSPLTPEGITQAQNLGKTLVGLHFDAVYSSPLGRASTTAETALGENNKIIHDPRLVEVGLGVMEGMLWEDAAEYYPKSAPLLSDPVNYIPPPKGEALPDMINRVSSFLDDVVKAGHNRAFVLTHGYTMRVIHACTMDKTVESIGKTPLYSNCEVVRYKFEDGKWIFMGVVPPQNAPGTENTPRPVPIKVEKFKSQIEKSLAPIIVLFAFITALLYTVSFTGIRVYPQLSFFIFCGLTVILLYTLLKRIGWLSHPRAFLWAIPLMIFAGFNMVFGRSAFTYINVAAAWILFAFIIYGAIHGAKYPFGALFFWVNIAKIIRGHLTAGVSLVSDTSSSYKLNKNHPALRFLIGIAIAIPLLILISALMMSADQVFAAFINDFFDGAGEFNLARTFGHIIAVAVATVFAAGYVYKAKVMTQSDANFKPFSLDKIIALAFLLAINVLFLAFCYIQLAYLFMGGLNSLPPGVVFAEYAREGFFQLLFLTIINFSVIIFFLQVYSQQARGGIIRVMLVLLTVFTGVLIASSFYRMNMYMQVFGFTPLRMAVITFLVMEVLLCAATLIALYNGKFDVMRVYLIIGMIFLVVANVSGSGFVSGRLNANLYRRSSEYHFTMRDHFWDADNASSLIEIYRMTDNGWLRMDIRDRLQDYQRRYANEPWQNRSIIKRVNMRQIRMFL
ncbi:MAG: DUF4173 domain-containing protein [Defluviitaleaceae bacterium]|nr:DUF4173 domain-containing protein [Defluviitaleaceae bacterium]